MKSLNAVSGSLKRVCEKYPAVVSGYFLVGYSFIAIIRMIVRAKKGNLLVEDVYDMFSALPFMWLLALSIVNIIHERSKMHNLEKALTREKEQRQLAELQLATLKNVEKTLQHQINTPLAVISLSLSRLKRAIRIDPDLQEETNDIEYATKKIGSFLTDFSRTEL